MILLACHWPALYHHYIAKESPKATYLPKFAFSTTTGTGVGIRSSSLLLHAAKQRNQQQYI
jgi:hypothetical protein